VKQGASSLRSGPTPSRDARGKAPSRELRGWSSSAQVQMPAQLRRLLSWRAAPSCARGYAARLAYSAACAGAEDSFPKRRAQLDLACRAI